MGVQIKVKLSYQEPSALLVCIEAQDVVTASSSLEEGDCYESDIFD